MRRTPAPRPTSARRYVGISVALACSLALITPIAVPSSVSALVSADPDPRGQKRQVDARIDDLRADLNETSASLAAAYTALETTKGKIPAAQTALSQAQNAATQAANANTLAAQELDVARANERQAQDELAATTRKITESRKDVAQFASQIYQEQGFGELDMAMSSTTPQEFAERVALIGTVMDIQGQSIDDLATAEASQTAQEDRISALRADSERAKKRAETALAAANAARDKAAAAKAALDQLSAAQTKQAAQFKAQLAIENKNLASMQAESNRLNAVIKARAAAALAKAKRDRAAAARAKAEADSRAGGNGGRPSRSTGRSGGPLRDPMPTGYVTSQFGMRFHPIYKRWKLHSGRDYAAPCGTPIRAAASGVIFESRYSSGYGNRIVIDHGVIKGVHLSTSYNHMQSVRRSSGRVKAGEIVGYEGSTGASTGCHLHFEVYEDGDWVDPRRWL